MQSNLLEKIELDRGVEDTSIKSYVQLAKTLASDDTVSIDEVLFAINKMDLIEDSTVIYGGKPAKVSYCQLPIIIGDDIKVKMVILAQADSLALIIPKHVAETYHDLKEDPSMLKQKNISLSLYVELYNFETNSIELFDLLKTVYLSAGDSLEAFEMPESDVKKAEDKNKEEDNLDSEDLFKSNEFSNTSNENPTSLGDFSKIEEPLGDIQELADNTGAYESFKKVSNNIYKLSNMLYNVSDKIIRENVRVGFFNSAESILVVEVNNKAIYNKLSHVPKLAKRLLTVFGETIRLNNGTQLIDSFIKGGKRYFVIAESAGNNFWVVNNDKLDVLDKDSRFIDPIQDKIIRLNRSSIRKESRKKIPYFKDSRIVFVSKNAGIEIEKKYKRPAGLDDNYGDLAIYHSDSGDMTVKIISKVDKGLYKLKSDIPEQDYYLIQMLDGHRYVLPGDKLTFVK